MIQDPENRYIETILANCDIRGKVILEIGCGKGRVTRDLAEHARRVTATDPDAAALATARLALAADNVEFLHAQTGVPDLPAGSFDTAIYTLSLHHVPPGEMSGSLHKVASLLREGGTIVIVEPDDGGSLTEAKERFGAGSGDERPAREAAVRAMHSLAGWSVGETVRFRTSFRFDDEEDFLVNLLPDYRVRPAAVLGEIRAFLDRHRSPDGIVLHAGRRLNVLKKNIRKE